MITGLCNKRATDYSPTQSKEIGTIQWSTVHEGLRKGVSQK